MKSAQHPTTVNNVNGAQERQEVNKPKKNKKQQGSSLEVKHSRICTKRITLKNTSRLFSGAV